MKYTQTIRLLFLALLITTNTFAQDDDWKLPKVDGGVRLDYTSQPIKAKGKEICKYYEEPTASSEVIMSLQSKIDTKGAKFFSYTGYVILPLFNSASVEEQMKYIGKSRCIPEKADTFFGSLNVNIIKSNIKMTMSGGVKEDISDFKCRYRIIFHTDNHFEISFKGFVLTSQKTTKGVFDRKEYFLDDIYNEDDTNKMQKNFYKDLKMITNVYVDVLTEFFQRKTKSEF
jgi:hypothetical protein